MEELQSDSGSRRQKSSNNGATQSEIVVDGRAGISPMTHRWRWHCIARVSGKGGEDVTAADPNAVSNFKISEVLKEKLKSNGIVSLFPIQAMNFNLVLDGSITTDL